MEASFRPLDGFRLFNVIYNYGFRLFSHFPYSLNTELLNTRKAAASMYKLLIDISNMNIHTRKQTHTYTFIKVERNLRHSRLTPLHEYKFNNSLVCLSIGGFVS